ncbi:DNA-binding transcriptional LysR family regulator [Paeniglutamicibacter psychrophenolicus]|nr:DNA-binding transcriptional LysR family regulator [Paeniglutamicibacter psychrophenolicus]
MTLAAERLHVAQSAISSAVAHLERQIGSQFFIRQRSKGLALTPAGEAFLRDALAVLGHVEDIVEKARGEQLSVAGRVRIACFSTLAPFLIPGLLSRLSQDYPQLVVEVLEADAAGCSNALLNGQADLALGYDLGIPEGVATTVVDRARPYLLLPHDHRFAKRSSLDLEDMAGEPFILLDMPYTRDLMLSLLRDTGISPEVRFQSGSFETVRTLVAHGHGYSILHQHPHHNMTYDGQQVAAVQITNAVPQLDIVIAHLRTQRATARMRAVGRCVRDQLAELSGQQPAEA